MRSVRLFRAAALAVFLLFGRGPAAVQAASAADYPLDDSAEASGTVPPPGSTMSPPPCLDKALNCDESLCTNFLYQQLMAENCAKTCKLCGGGAGGGAGGGGGGAGGGTGGPGGGPGGIGDCRDVKSSCEYWKANGFCENKFYTPEVRKANCAKSCGLC